MWLYRKLRLGIFLGFYKVPMGKRVGAKVLLLAKTIAHASDNLNPKNLLL